MLCSPQKCLYKRTGNEVLGSPAARCMRFLQPLLRSFVIDRVCVCGTQVFVLYGSSLPMEGLVLPMRCPYVSGGSRGTMFRRCRFVGGFTFRTLIWRFCASFFTGACVVVAVAPIQVRQADLDSSAVTDSVVATATSRQGDVSDEATV